MSTTRIKLVAIARNEGAYLPQWIFHHLHFGFDSVEILINQTSDATYALDDKLRDLLAVRFRNVDSLYESEDGQSFQKRAYRDAYNRASDEGYSHVAFLDIDELWTSSDFSSSIHHFLCNSDADVLLTPWAVPAVDPIPFGEPFPDNLWVYLNKHVKAICRTSLDIKEHGVHAPYIQQGRYRLIDGSAIPDWDGHRIHDLTCHNGLGGALILHRMWRSPPEYISSLAQGLRQASTTSNHIGLTLKTNRKGYGKAPPLPEAYPFLIRQQLANDYRNRYLAFLHEYRLQSIIAENQKFVVSRFYEAVGMLNHARKTDSALVERLLQRLDSNLILDKPSEWLSAALSNQ